MIRPALAALLLGVPATAQACDGAGRCEIKDDAHGGTYHVALPDDWAGGPAVIHLHGFGGSGARVVANEGFVAGINARGYALIAPSALPWDRSDGTASPPDWSVRDGVTYRRDDVAFLDAVLDDAAARHGIARDKVLMSGFSRGGSMTWEVACLNPDTVAAYAPAAGGFWLPEVVDCAGPVAMLHSHGFSDKIVPLEGRKIPIPEGITQGDVWRGLTVWRAENGCRTNADHHATTPETWRKVWPCEAGSLELVLHPGGHALPKGWTKMALDWFEALP